MNELIERIFNNFTVGGVQIPVRFLFYNGHGEPYVVYSQINADSSLSADDELIDYADYYDFDVYSKGDYLLIVEMVKELLEANDFRWMPSLSSEDMYEEDTGYFHKTLNFQYLKGI